MFLLCFGDLIYVFFAIGDLIFMQVCCVLWRAHAAPYAEQQQSEQSRAGIDRAERERRQGRRHISEPGNARSKAKGEAPYRNPCEANGDSEREFFNITLRA